MLSKLINTSLVSFICMTVTCSASQRDQGGLEISQISEQPQSSLSILPGEIWDKILRKDISKKFLYLDKRLYDVIRKNTSYIKLSTFISNKDLMSIVESFPNLSTLNLFGCYKITDCNSLLKLKNLRYIDLTWCGGSTNAVINSLSTQRPKLQIIDNTKYINYGNSWSH